MKTLQVTHVCGQFLHLLSLHLCAVPELDAIGKKIYHCDLNPKPGPPVQRPFIHSGQPTCPFQMFSLPLFNMMSSHYLPFPVFSNSPCNFPLPTSQWRPCSHFSEQIEVIQGSPLSSHHHIYLPLVHLLLHVPENLVSCSSQRALLL